MSYVSSLSPYISSDTLNNTSRSQTNSPYYSGINQVPDFSKKSIIQRKIGGTTGYASPDVDTLNRNFSTAASIIKTPVISNNINLDNNATPPLVETGTLYRDRSELLQFASNGVLSHYKDYVVRNLTPEGTMEKPRSEKDATSILIRKRLDEGKNTYSIKNKNKTVEYKSNTTVFNTDNRDKFHNNKLRPQSEYIPRTIVPMRTMGGLPEPSHIQTNELA
jgi:hypothetical protein